MWRWARNVKGKGKYPEGPVGGIKRIKEVLISRAESHLHNKSAEAVSKHFPDTYLYDQSSPLLL